LTGSQAVDLPAEPFNLTYEGGRVESAEPVKPVGTDEPVASVDGLMNGFISYNNDGYYDKENNNNNNSDGNNICQ
jgi:hypothetical protein